MSLRKPIFIVYLPETTNMNSVHITREHLRKDRISEDYHVLVIAGSKDVIRCEMFSEVNIPDITLQELEEKVRLAYQNT